MGVSVYLLCHIKFSLPPATKGVIKEKKPAHITAAK